MATCKGEGNAPRRWKEMKRVNWPRGGINDKLRWLPINVHKQLDGAVEWIRGKPAKKLMPFPAEPREVLEADARHIAKAAQQTFERDGPILVVASGHDTITIASSIKKLVPDHVFLVQIQHPRSRLHRFDLVITPQHDYYPLSPEAQEQIPLVLRRRVTPRKPPDKHVVLTVGALHQADSDALRNEKYGADLAMQLTASIKSVLPTCGSIRISFSRQTPKIVRTHLRVYVIMYLKLNSFPWLQQTGNGNLTGLQICEKWEYVPLDDTEKAAAGVIKAVAQRGWRLLPYLIHPFLVVKAMEKSEAAAIEMGNTSRESKGKALLLASAVHHNKAAGGYKRGAAVFDLILRVCAVAAAMAATIAMATTEQTLLFFTQFFQFQASYDDLPTFTSILRYSDGNGDGLPHSLRAFLHRVHCSPRCYRGSPPTHHLRHTGSYSGYISRGCVGPIVYLAHNGNSDANWLAICQQFNDFCQRASGAVVASFSTVVLIIFLVVISAVALRKH
ncbi:hypothetical protein SASPL_138459 [Salvia splendens]|uniref:Casparian strip membrane protein domain-containing protein n=1 Tax=Salvia splendens TaxID=180675 RepID=A0A8X8ZEB6_SALSN|nr:hypothetical protein SASPL_138459 [Salvia splendens]